MVQPPPDGDRSRGSQLIALSVTLLAMSTIIVLARLFTRSVIIKRLGPDDFFIVIGFVSNLISDIYLFMTVRLIRTALIPLQFDC